jgi:WD40 repeat protein
VQDIEAHGASLAGAHLSETVLGEAFGYPTSLALSADGAYLVAGTESGEVCWWRVADRTLLAALRGHTGGVCEVALSEDGRLVASGGLDGTVRLWDTSNSTLRRTLRAERRYEGLDITGLTGVTEAQRRVLFALGVVERSGKASPSA